MPQGFNGRILWIDLTRRTFRLEERPQKWFRLYAGGGLLAEALLLEHTAPGLDPLGPDNLLIFTSSVAGPGIMAVSHGFSLRSLRHGWEVGQQGVHHHRRGPGHRGGQCPRVCPRRGRGRAG